jgi:lipopolysaccharide/colanic/teichoic acid biosynthesis glycosyltransferase
VIKRLFDMVFSLILVVLLSPLLILFSFLIWKQDKEQPFYIAERVGKNEKLFKMMKFRSMVVNADKSGIDSTTSNDPRITSLGHFIRKYKIDELPNFFNIFLGQMSFVGPRPNVKRETDIYTNVEKLLLSVRPGITDLASIVFSDEGEILSNSQDPDLDYNQLIRPWKSRLGIFYVENNSLLVDIKLILITIIALISRRRALLAVSRLLAKLDASANLVSIALREQTIVPTPPPGAIDIVKTR